MPRTTAHILVSIVRDGYMIAQTVYNLLLAATRSDQAFRWLPPDHHVAPYPRPRLVVSRYFVIVEYQELASGPRFGQTTVVPAARKGEVS